VTWQKYNLLST